MEGLKWPSNTGTLGKVVPIELGRRIQEARTIRILQIVAEIDRLEGECKRTVTFFGMTERYGDRRRAQIRDQITQLILEKETLEAQNRSPLPKR